MYKKVIKRLLDILISIIGIIFLFFPMMIISIAIFITDPGPIWFKQKRIGMNKNGKITYFSLLKFRSMREYI